MPAVSLTWPMNQNAANAMSARNSKFMIVFDMTGTAVEVTPIRSVDRLTIGAGRRGPVTETLQKAFFGLFTGATPDKWGWLDYVDMQARPRVAAG